MSDTFRFSSGPADKEPLRFDTDVLVLGGGPAGAWAAWSAASRGARVTLADKGYLGSSGATAPGGNNVLYVEPDQRKRDEAVAARMKQGGYLSEARWVHRLLDHVYENLKLVEGWGYPFPKDENGQSQRSHLQGPEYMRLMRKVVKQAGVRILDQSPALELLADEHGVGGARGISRLDGRPWHVTARAVVIATGGCAFLSKALGCNVNTGDGLLMAAELGTELSGMEFARHYAPSAGGGTVTRGRMLGWATYTSEDGTVLDRRGPDALAKALLQGPVYAVLDKADTPEKQAILRQSHAIFFLPLDRAGFDPFKDRFPVTLRYEGTVRGVGGIRILDDDCATTVCGLYAAGDAASRQLVTGAASGGGAFNAAWALSSGDWAGKAAAQYAQSLGDRVHDRRLRSAGQAGIRPSSDDAKQIDTAGIVKAVQDEVFPLEINYFRSEPILKASLERLHSLWPAVNGGLPGHSVEETLRAREAAAMVATARWAYTAALARTETRGMHSLKEHPEQDPNQQYRLTTTGLDTITVRPEGPVLRHEPFSFDILNREVVPA